MPNYMGTNPMAGGMGGGGGSVGQALAMAHRGMRGPGMRRGGARMQEGGLPGAAGINDIGPDTGGGDVAAPPMDPIELARMRDVAGARQYLINTGRASPFDTDPMSNLGIGMENHLTAMEHIPAYAYPQNPYVLTPEQVAEIHQRQGEVGHQLINAGMQMIPLGRAAGALKPGLSVAERLGHAQDARDWMEGIEFAEDPFKQEEHKGGEGKEAHDRPKEHNRKEEKKATKPGEKSAEHHKRGGKIYVREHWRGGRAKGGVAKKALALAKRKRKVAGKR